MQNLSVGSHIKTSRMGYSHHGIYCGDGKVVHYAGFAQAFNKGILEVTTLKKFLGNEVDCYIVRYPANKVMFSPQRIVRRALGRVGEDSYNLAFNNCEHFACWCVTNKSESKQVKTVLLHSTVTLASYKTINISKLVSATAGTGAAFGTSGALAALGGGALAAGAAPVIVPFAVGACAVVGACTVVGGIISEFLIEK